MCGLTFVFSFLHFYKPFINHTHVGKIKIKLNAVAGKMDSKENKVKHGK